VSPEGPDEAELEAALDRFLERERDLFGGPRQTGLPDLSEGRGLRFGQTIGDYELVRRLGVGGMGVVFEARQRSVDGRRVAVKILRDVFASEAVEERFKREVATVAQFDHPGIVPIVDAEVEQGTPYFVMKFIEGLSLAQLISRLRERPGFPEVMEDLKKIVTLAARPDSISVVAGSSGEAGSEFRESYPRWVVRVGRGLADALQYAHDHGFVHRDVKPGNVMITLRGGPVLLDFGLASGSHGDALTRTGEFLGTAAYAAPEQLRGEPADGRSDVYSLGATLYELLSLRRPHEAPNRSALLRLQEREDPPALPRWVPADLRTIVTHALTFAPSQRYATPAALAQDCDRFLHGQPIRARPLSVPQRLFRLAKRYPRLVVAAAAVLLALAVMRGRDHLAARARVADGRALLARAGHDVDEWNDLLARYARLTVQDPVPFQELAPLEARIDAAALEAANRFGRAEDELQRAFDSVAGYGPARAALAELHARRLRQALRVCTDMLRPGEFRQLEDHLRHMDDAGAHAELLDHTGSIRIRCAMGPARLWVLADDAARKVVYSGTTGDRRIALPEGSYLARASLPGYVDVRFPLLVRREACYEDPGARPGRDVDLEFLKPNEIPPGFVQIPAGDTLLEDHPPRWEFVESFLIQEHEVTNGEFLDWLSHLDPRILESAELPEIEGRPYVLAGEDGAFRLALSQELASPLRGLSPMAMNGYARALCSILPRGREDRLFSLPTLAELIRAGRGADGRRYPWGSEFRYEACANYLSTVSYGSDMFPLAVQSFPEDRSPFGIFDLAGSVAEATRSLYPPLPGHYAVLGGSFRSAKADELALTHVRGLRNGPYADVGFRLVLRTLPAALCQPDRSPRPFEDRFDRADSKVVGNGWVQVIGPEPLALRTNPTTRHGSELVLGKLVCRSGTGNFSETSSAWHRVQLADSGWRVTAALAGRTEPGFEEWATRRCYNLVLTSSFGGFDSDCLNLQMPHGEGPVSLIVTRAGVRAAAAEYLPEADPDRIEIECKDDEIRVWAFEEGGPKPEQPAFTCVLPRDFQRPRYVGLSASVGGGASAELDWIRVEPLR